MELQTFSGYRDFERGQGKYPPEFFYKISLIITEQYTATATAKGAGRSGHVECDGLKFNLAVPKEMGGNGKGENPEQLFAMGYSSPLIISLNDLDQLVSDLFAYSVLLLLFPGCLLGAIQASAKRLGKSEMAKNAVVRASVHIGQTAELDGFGLAVDIKVEGVDEEIVKAGHEVGSFFLFCCGFFDFVLIISISSARTVVL